MTVGELGERMDAAELMEWLSFDRVHTSEEWYQNALIRHTICQVVGGKAKLDDFLPAREKARPEPGDVFGKFCGWAAQHNARLGVGL